MLKKVIRKIKSEKGASLSMALLLFMVCAVVGSVVLVAATTASGRMSQFGESEQRYYAVTSAARLLAQELNGKEVTVTRTKVDTSTYIDDVFSSLESSTSGPTISDGTTAPTLLKTQTTKLEDYLRTNSTSEVWDVVYSDVIESSSSASAITGAVNSFTMEFKVGENSVSEYTCTCTSQMYSDGTMNILVTSAENNGNSYTMTMILQPVFQETEGTSYNEKQTTDETTGSVTSVITTTTTKTFTVSWNVSSFR